jgi:cyclase
MQKITENIYVETDFPGCNVGFVVTEEGVVMMDTPMVPSNAVSWRGEIAKFGPLRYLINTEPHNDHISGNSFFGGVVVGHEGAREQILNASVERTRDLLRRMAPESLPETENLSFRPPTITYSERLTLYLGKHTFKLIHMPGHTPFQTAVYIPEERVVFTSDNVTGGSPFFRQSVPYEWLESLGQIEELDVDILVPGHGPVCDKSSIAKMRAIISSCIDAVASAVDRGMSLEEAQNTVSLMGEDTNIEKNDFMIQAEHESIARLYEVIKESRRNRS